MTDKGYVQQKFIDKGYAQQRLCLVRKYWQKAMLSEIHNVIWSFYVKRNKQKIIVFGVLISGSRETVEWL